MKEIDMKICQNIQNILHREENLIIKFFNFLYNIRMSKTYLKFVDVSMKNRPFHCSEY